LDLNGDGIQRGALSHYFDLNADGQMDRIESLGADDAMLVMDRNGNGQVDDGKEVFGDQHGAADGFEELRKYDDNQDGVIDAKDAVYGKLSLWADHDGNGLRSAGELVSLQDRQVDSITLPGQGKATYGQERSSTYTRAGRVSTAADLWLRFEQVV
jgi:hypothetical protein